MRIALPIADGKFSTHYGRSEALSLHEIDPETGIRQDLGLRLFPEGTCSGARWVAGQGVEVLLAGGIGAGAAKGLESAGVRVLVGINEEDPVKVLAAFAAGGSLFRELQAGESACHGHEEGEDDHGHGEDHVCTCAV